MVPKARKIRCRRGVTLVETLIAVTILLIALIGTSTFRYAAALDGRRADAHTSAARVALSLSESWRGLKGDANLDATQLGSSDMTVSVSGWTGHQTPGGFTLLGNYAVVLDDDDPDSANYYATMSWSDVQPGLRALNVSVAWAQRAPGGDGTENVDKAFSLTVYTQTY
ncbi:MAG: type IV pilus modification PilV family protein [Planctomycetota bacterium]